MSDLHTATVIADVDLTDTVEFPVRLSATTGLLRGTFAKLKTYLKAGLKMTDFSDVDISTPPTDAQALLWNASSLKWKPGAAGSGGSGGGGSGALVPLATTTLGAAQATISLTGIDQTYADLIVVVTARGDAAATFADVRMTLNNDTGTNYDTQRSDLNNGTLTGAGAVAAAFGFIGWIPAASGVANAASSLEIVIPSYANTTFHKDFFSRSGLRTGAAAANMFENAIWGDWRSTAAVNRIDLALSTGNFVAGTKVTVYGRKSSIASGTAGNFGYEGFGNLLSIAGLTKLAGASANLTLTDGLAAHNFTWSASGANTMQVADQAQAAGSFTYYLRFMPMTTFGTNTQFGLVFRNSTSGKLINFSYNSDLTLSVQEWTNPTTFSSNIITQNVNKLTNTPIWMKVTSDGTTLSFYYSDNGMDWLLLTTRTIATFMGSIDRAGIGGVPQVAGTVFVSNFGQTAPAILTGATAGGLVKIAKQVVSVATPSVDFSGIPATYEDLVIVINGQLSGSADFVLASLNNDTAANYQWVRGVFQNAGISYTNGTTTGLAIGLIGGAAAGAAYNDVLEATIYSYARTVFHKRSLSRSSLRSGTLASAFSDETQTAEWLNTAAVNQVTVRANSGNFTVGTVITIYGRG
jgi:hypothetical protein